MSGARTILEVNRSTPRSANQEWERYYEEKYRPGERAGAIVVR